MSLDALVEQIDEKLSNLPDSAAARELQLGWKLVVAILIRIVVADNAGRKEKKVMRIIRRWDEIVSTAVVDG